MAVVLLFIRSAIINGIVVGVLITALSFVIVYLLKKGTTPNLLTYIVLLPMLAILSFEGFLLSNSVKTKRDTNDIVALVQDAILTCLPIQGQDYVITPQQSHAIKIAMRVASPSIANRVDARTLSGKTVAEATDVVREAIERYTARKMRSRIFLLVVSSVLLAAVLFLSFGSNRRSGRKRKSGSGLEYESTGATRYGGDDF